MFGWFSNSSKKEIQSPIITTQQGNEMTIPQNLVSIDDIVLLEKSENWLEMITACDWVFRAHVTTHSGRS